MWVPSPRRLAPTTATGMRSKWETRGSKVSTCTWPPGSRNTRSRVRRQMRIRRFLLRGLQKVRAEWKLICLTHNLLKLFRSGRALQMSYGTKREKPCIGCEKGPCVRTEPKMRCPRFPTSDFGAAQCISNRKAKLVLTYSRQTPRVGESLSSRMPLSNSTNKLGDAISQVQLIAGFESNLISTSVVDTWGRELPKSKKFVASGMSPVCSTTTSRPGSQEIPSTVFEFGLLANTLITVRGLSVISSRSRSIFH